MGITQRELELAEPDPHYKVEAWYLDDSMEDQRLPHRRTPNVPCPSSKLKDLGVLYWHLDADKHESDERLEAIRKVRNYTYKDVVTVSREALPKYDEMLHKFFEEHIHGDEEIRFFLEGSGYFDVRDLDDSWIRIHCKKGDMIVLPEGIYHRFSMDESNYGKAMRLFVGEPVWVPYNRPQEEHSSRQKYVQSFSLKV